MKAVTAAEMREIDRISIDEYGIPAAVLMNNAGKAVAEFIKNNFGTASVDIFCGTGNNGGDGFTAAYYLKNSGYDPLIYISGAREKITPVSIVFLKICEKLKIPVTCLDEKNITTLTIRPGSVVIDSLTGTGFEGALRGVTLEVVNAINRSQNSVVAVDLPSGISSDGEAPGGEAVKSDYTVTMGLPKISLVTYPGKAYCGKVITSEIGFPGALTADEKLKVNLIDKEFIKSADIFNLDDDIHKGDRGNTLIVGGFTGMEGAAILAASAMFRTGTGLVTVATTDNSRNIIAGKIPELMTLPLPDKLLSESIPEILELKKFNTLIIGPGLGRDNYSAEIFKAFMAGIKNSGICRVLIDGDGLFHLAYWLKENSLIDDISYIITPHFMEASRIINTDIQVIKNNRLKYCIEISGYTGCTTVLKGPASIISDSNKSFINTTGNRGLATAGSGDVLSGIIGAFLSRGISPAVSCAAGVYIHGLCADLFSEQNVLDSMSSSEILNFIRPAIAGLIKD